MLVQAIKCIHVLTAISLLGLVYGFTLSKQILHYKKPLLHTGLLAAATGLLLVYPRHFNFQTPWIEAAIVGTTLFIFIVMLFFKKSFLSQRAVGLLLIALLVVIVHDAVTKTALLHF